MTNKQLTRNEILKLRARAIAKADEFQLFDTWDFLPEDEKHNYRLEAQATIEADEKAGVLKLVEEDESILGDVIETLDTYSDDYLHVFKNYVMKVQPEHEGDCTRVAHTCMICFVENEIESLKELSLRLKKANIPVYQLRKEEPDGK